MKKTLLYITFLLILVFGFKIEASTLSNGVPEQVKSFISSHYPSAEKIKWKKHEEFYTVHFLYYGVEYFIVLNHDGLLQERVVEIKSTASLPESLRNKLGSTKVNYIEKIEAVTGEVYYVFEINRDHKTVEMIFESDGTEVKEIVVKKSEKNKSQEHLAILSFYSLHFN